jgi:hypothetical protein
LAKIIRNTGWINKLETDTPQTTYRLNLKGYVEFTAANSQINNKELASFRIAQANQKKRSKKTTGCTVINPETLTRIKEEKKKKQKELIT